uniref:Uncharacterized protein n=1 Tax=Molossus molossus TaxID=27622 RepID=A0A7J8E2W9_MOLMO|nr:hypothetical protein HJG59_009068 [Molossus molossus]
MDILLGKSEDKKDPNQGGAKPNTGFEGAGSLGPFGVLPGVVLAATLTSLSERKNQVRCHGLDDNGNKKGPWGHRTSQVPESLLCGRNERTRVRFRWRQRGDKVGDAAVPRACGAGHGGARPREPRFC